MLPGIANTLDRKMPCTPVAKTAADAYTAARGLWDRGSLFVVSLWRWQAGATGIAEPRGDNRRLRTRSTDDFHKKKESKMGDKGGKKEKDKNKKQKALKQEQLAKGKQKPKQ
jgi:hypothetical protein